jgi:toxin FitB
VSYLLDTNVLSETRRLRPDPGLQEWLSAAPPEHLHVSVLTIAEIQRGITKLLHRGDHRQAAAFGRWLDELIEEFGGRLVPVTVQVAQQWGRQSPTHPLPTIDALIAATATVHAWTLVTRNGKDFQHAGVQVLNPFTG